MENIDYENRLTKAEERGKSNSKRLDACEKKLADNEKTLQVISALAVKQDRVEKDMAEVKQDVKTLINKPGKKWEKVVETIIIAAVGCLIAFVFFKLGLSAA